MRGIVILSFFLCIVSSSNIFSGFYHAKNNEEYGGAFLVSTSRLVNSTERVASSWYPEGVIFSVVQKHLKCLDCNTLFLRDYFDFSSDHLSSLTNIVGTMSMETQQKILRILNHRLEETVHELKRWTSNSTRRKIVGIIPFSEEVANPGGQDPAYLKLHQDIRRNFFKASFYSVYRYFSNVVVYVTSEANRKLLLDWKIPARAIVDLDDVLAKVPKEKYFFIQQGGEARPRNQLLPKYALLSAIESLRNDPEWAGYRYVYYTEGDQMLHLRKLKHLLRAIDMRDGKDLIIPHRMETLPLFQNFPPAIQSHWGYQKLSVNLITETALPELTGSCCDNGRFDFPDCGNWWYYCEKWGIRNHSVWIQFGSNGFTMPLSTEHQGICSYTPNQILCPLPKTCGNGKNRYDTSSLCGEVEISIARQRSYESVPPISIE